MAEDPTSEFIRHSQWHGSLTRCAAILAEHPEIATASIHVAAILGDDATVRRCVAAEPASATTAGGPFGRDPLTHLCFSRYLRLDPARAGGFERAAAALLDAGASPTTGFFDRSHQPHPCFESVLYGAAGVAHHPGVTRLLLERGADPNDPPAYEVPYHAPETDDNRALALLVETGKLSAWSLNLMLVRKADWHDVDGALYLLQHGANPGLTGDRGRLVLPHALERDNALPMIRHLLEFGADPLQEQEGVSPAVIAARRGRGDCLALFADRGVALAFTGVDRLSAACARQDDAAIAGLRTTEPAMVEALRAEGGRLMVRFALNGNSGGLRRLIDLGVPVDAMSAEGESYWGLAPGSTALMSAAWRFQYDAVDQLLARGAKVNARNDKGQSALTLALLACTDSYWMGWRSLRALAPLLDAGADLSGVTLPTGYPEADQLLRARGA
jgi:ankyrin repeat protein